MYLLIKYGHMFWQKYIRENYISTAAVVKKVEDVEARLNRHLEKEAITDVRFGKMETEQTNLKERMETETNHIFSQLKSLHEKFDKLTQIMLEKNS